MSDSIPSDILAAIKPIMLSELNLESLAKQVQTTVGVVPFVGAGLSIPYGYPGWTDFLLKTAEVYGVQADVQAHLDRGEYDSAAQIVAHNAGY